ncbi:GrpB family protein [Roseibium sp. SCPC15]|uniref:GrpB family protein n=1 Tax=Roseibium sp. SCP15 TaxID=3141376 RepID=UPI003337A617
MTIELVGHDPSWSEQADRLIGDLRCLLGDTVARLDHVGSTSIPGLMTKPKLHIDVVLCPGISPEPVSIRLEEFGYANLGYLHNLKEIQLTRSKGFCFGPRQSEPELSVLAHRLCICRSDCLAPVKRRRFRDALRNNPTLVQEYEKLKQDLIAKFGNPPDWDRYNGGKTDFINAVVEDHFQ